MGQPTDDDREPGDEPYGLSWPGKRAALASTLTAATGTLRPCPEESLDWDTTRNLIIEGDNLEVLKLLPESYAGKVAMIHIDPPYNTGAHFTYGDRFSGSPAWLNMLYPRLVLARALLSEQGLIVVHIDEHEQSRLHLLLGEIFGEENHIGTCVWDKMNPKGDARGIAYQHELIVIYARKATARLSASAVRRPKKNAARMIDAAARFTTASSSPEEAAERFRAWVRQQAGLSGGEAMYHRLSADGRVYRLVSMAWPNKQTAPDRYFVPLIHPVSGEPCPVPTRGWRNPPETMRRLLDEGHIEFGADASTQPQRRYYLDENMTEPIPSILPYGGSDDALLEDWSLRFDHPKPVRFVTDLISWFSDRDGIVLDCFAGSGTVGHAVWRANAQDGGSRRFILVELGERPARGDAESIAAITRARLRRAAGEFDSDSRRSNDHGFRAFRLELTGREVFGVTQPE